MCVTVFLVAPCHQYHAISVLVSAVPLPRRCIGQGATGNTDFLRVPAIPSCIFYQQDLVITVSVFVEFYDIPSAIGCSLVLVPVHVKGTRCRVHGRIVDSCSLFPVKEPLKAVLDHLVIGGNI